MVSRMLICISLLLGSRLLLGGSEIIVKLVDNKDLEISVGPDKQLDGIKIRYPDKWVEYSTSAQGLIDLDIDDDYRQVVKLKIPIVENKQDSYSMSIIPGQYELRFRNGPVGLIHVSKEEVTFEKVDHVVSYSNYTPLKDPRETCTTISIYSNGVVLHHEDRFMKGNDYRSVDVKEKRILLSEVDQLKKWYNAASQSEPIDSKMPNKSTINLYGYRVDPNGKLETDYLIRTDEPYPGNSPTTNIKINKSKEAAEIINFFKKRFEVVFPI